MTKALRIFMVVLLAMVFGQADAQIFTETFSKCEGKGGNDNTFSGITGNKNLSDDYTDNAGWTHENALAASGCVSVGISKTAGFITTPKLKNLNGDATLTFKAAAWAKDKETLTLAIEGGGSLNMETVTLKKGEFSDYSVAITGGTAQTKITFKGTEPQNRFFLDEVNITEEGGVTKKNPNLSFSNNDVNAVLGEPFTAPTLTKETPATVTYSSSDENVATVDAASGAVIILAVGKTTITAIAEATEEYNAGSASYTITVTEPAKSEVVEPYEETFENGQGSFTINDVSLGSLNYVWKHNSEYKCMKASAYANKKNNASESWLISPWIELSSAEVIRYARFDQCISKYFGDVTKEATVWIKEQGGEWHQATITYPEIPADKSFSNFEQQTISLAGYEGKKIQIGFKYISTDDAAGTWEIRNFSVNSSLNSINSLNTDNKTTDNAIYNLAGQRLQKLQKGINIVGGKKIIKK